LWELILPLNKYGITPEFVATNDLDPYTWFHLVLLL
jgi:hypothetical protein